MRTLTSPCRGRERDSRVSTTSISTRSVSPGRTGFDPGQFAAAADDPAGRAEGALDTEPHRHRRGVPAACGEAVEQALARRILVEMEGLRVELRGEGLDLGCIDPARFGAELLADRKILEISHAHDDASWTPFRGNSAAFTPLAWVCLNQAPEATADDRRRPYVTSATLKATNTQPSEPVSDSAIQPPPTAINRRSMPANSGHNSFPAPCEAKYSA